MDAGVPYTTVATVAIAAIAAIAANAAATIACSTACTSKCARSTTSRRCSITPENFNVCCTSARRDCLGTLFSLQHHALHHANTVLIHRGQLLPNPRRVAHNFVARRTQCAFRCGC